MKEFSVYVDIVTKYHEINRKFLPINLQQIQPRHTDKGFLWRIESNVEACATIGEHIDCIIGYFYGYGLMAFDSKIIDISLSIGVFHDTITCSISLPSEIIDKITNLFGDIVIEITCYPCT